MADMGKMLILVGAVLVAAGLLLYLGPKLPLFGKLPGDIVIRRDNFTLYLPLGTSVLISVLLSLILYVIGRSR